LRYWRICAALRPPIAASLAGRLQNAIFPLPAD
jgi:hypothetical protein